MESDYLGVLMNVISKPKDALTFLHNANNEVVVNNILKRGFNFCSYIDYSSDCVTAADYVSVKYFTIMRQAYGMFTVIIQINKKLVEHYSNFLENKPHHFSEIFSIKPPVKGCDGDLMFCLAPEFVRGYINSQTAKFFPNPIFNSKYNPPLFKNNLESILQSK